MATLSIPITQETVVGHQEITLPYCFKTLAFHVCVLASDKCLIVTENKSIEEHGEILVKQMMTYDSEQITIAEFTEVMDAAYQTLKNLLPNEL